MISRSKIAVLVLAAGALADACVGASSAQAQNGMFNQPYSFPTTNRGSMAVVIKQAESGMFENASSSSATSTGGGSSPILICGGSGGNSQTSSTAGATANSSCIILNNSTGKITVGQDSTGSQTATSGVDQVNQALQSNPATD